MQGKIAEDIAQDFIRKVNYTLGIGNFHALHVQALISGRTVVIDANSKHLNKEGQILHLLPYYIPQHERHNYIIGNNLLKTDQRQQWWQNYGRLTGKEYSTLPEDLNRPDLDDITAQPLLNYLVALSYEHGELDFSQPININAIYNDLLNAVFRRAYAGQQHLSISSLALEDFVGILEEIGLATWHGNGRTTTVSEVEQHCSQNGRGSMLNVFEEGAKAGVTRLLTAFYFRQNGQRSDNEPTFEFTHKSFAEYLTALRIVRGIEQMFEQFELRKKHSSISFNEQKALEDWAKLCGPSEITNYLFKLLCNELEIRGAETAAQWQDLLVSIIGYLLRHGMPMEKLTKIETHKEKTRQARNAEEALLASLNACARVTKQLSHIDWPDRSAAKSWLVRLNGSEDTEWEITPQCLSFIDLDGCSLEMMNLFDFNFYRSSLKRTDLSFALMGEANFVESDLTQAEFFHTNLQAADFRRANLTNTIFNGANLTEADFSGADLRDSKFSSTRWYEAYYLQGIEQLRFDFTSEQEVAHLETEEPS